MTLFYARSAFCNNNIDDEVWDDPALADYDTCRQVYEEMDHTEDDLQSEFMDILSVEQPDSGVHYSARKTPTNLWENGRIPAVIEAGMTITEQKRVACAVKFFEERTCVRFVKKTATDLDYLYIRKADNRGGCFSESLGKKGGTHIVNYDQYSLHCWRHGTIVHELMHAIGFFHEQARNDRDKYIQVHWENIPKTDRFKRQFMTANDLGLDQQLIGEYDYQSVMHYSRWLFSQSDPAMSSLAPPPHQSSTNEAMGNRVAPTEMDRFKINTLYQCDPRLKVTVPTTVSLPPVDRSIAIFGGKIRKQEKQDNKNELYIPGSEYGSIEIDGLPGGINFHSHVALLLDNVVYQEIRYLLGGGTDSANDQIQNSMKKFNLITGEWSDGPSIKQKRLGAAGGVIGKKLFVCGGHTGARGDLSSCEVFDTQREQWQFIAPTSLSLAGLAAAVHREQLYIIVTGEWEFQANLNRARWGHSAAVVNDTIFICGGSFGSLAVGEFVPDATGSCEMFDLGSSHPVWESMNASMKSPRMMMQLVNFNNNLFAMGGHGNSGFGLDSVEKYDWTTEQWLAATPSSLLYRNADFAAVALPVASMPGQQEYREKPASIESQTSVQTSTMPPTTASTDEITFSMSNNCRPVRGRNVIYDPSCSEGESRGCNAGRQGQNCRFCWAARQKCK